MQHLSYMQSLKDALSSRVLQLGRSEEAHAALSPAVELYGAMEMTLWLPQAEAALATSREQPNHQHPA
jgi:hypothetical protein